ncbi:MAG: ribose 5-phosphate isomerase B [Phycisphaerae bacterium]|jgi:ribose 5-phosphate isomerase B
MKVAVASDHRGYESKTLIKGLLENLGHECIDFGTDGNRPVDYPDLAYAAGTAVADGTADRAILICGTGIGMCIAANKLKGIRAALCFDEINARVSRQHNDANVLCLSGDLLGENSIRRIVEIWLSSDFDNGRHERRVRKIDLIEQGLDPRTM